MHNLNLHIIFNGHWAYKMVHQASGNLTQLLEFFYSGSLTTESLWSLFLPLTAMTSQKPSF